MLLKNLCSLAFGNYFLLPTSPSETYMVCEVCQLPAYPSVVFIVQQTGFVVENITSLIQKTSSLPFGGEEQQTFKPEHICSGKVFPLLQRWLVWLLSQTPYLLWSIFWHCGLQRSVLFLPGAERRQSLDIRCRFSCTGPRVCGRAWFPLCIGGYVPQCTEQCYSASP